MCHGEGEDRAMLRCFYVMFRFHVSLFLFQSSTARMALTEELLFVRKMQAIIDICSECKNLLKAFRLELNITDGKSVCSTLC